MNKFVEPPRKHVPPHEPSHPDVAQTSKSLSECSCELWKINIERINAPIILQQIRSGTSFQCDQFQYCPWCGKGLTGSKATGNETSEVRLPTDPQQLLVTTARDAGFSDTQWKAMFYEQGPYDVTFPCFTTKKFIALLLERLQPRAELKASEGPTPSDIQSRPLYTCPVPNCPGNHLSASSVCASVCGYPECGCPDITQCQARNGGER